MTHDPGNTTTRHRPRPLRHMRLQCAFTLIELLVVVAIIGLLVAILLPVLGSAKDSARQALRLSNMRQMMVGYSSHHAENKGQVLYGKPPFAGVNGRPLSVKVAGQTLNDPLIASRYPWRLEPYIDGMWDLLYAHTDTPEVPQPGESASEIAKKAYTLSLSPGFGLNSVYVGGDAGADGFISNGYGLVPNRGQHVVFKDTEVRRASELIVFTDVKEVKNNTYATTKSGEHAGFLQATPPRLKGLPRWHVEGGEIKSVLPNITGLPEGYAVDATTTGFFDGHAETLEYEALSDMRLWANEAQSPDYDYASHN